MNNQTHSSILKNYYNMKITKADLNTQFNSQIPIDVRVTNGYTNVVLALWKDSNYCESNTYLPKWQVVNAEYYNANRDKYEGWIDLEDQLPPKELQ